MPRTFCIVFLLALPAALSARQPVPCAGDSTYATLDFWVGDWNVYVGDQLVGTNRISKVLRGCAVSEEWRDADGSEGRSLFYVDPTGPQWKQVWVTDDARRVGGTKEKHLISRLTRGGVRFQGELRLPDGRVLLDRTTLTPEGGAEVRQLIEVSNDGGTTWRVTFDAHYRPKR